MTPQEIASAINTLGLSQSQAAAVLGYGAPSRVSEITTGKKVPSKSVVRLLRAYLDGYRPDDWPKECDSAQS